MTEQDPSGEPRDPDGPSARRLLRAWFDAARQLRPEEREAWLAAHVPSRADRELVLDLLRRVREELDAERRPPADAGPLMGRQLGAWTIDGWIGAGGMAQVYRGIRADGTRAAIKVLRSEWAGPALERRWEREVRATQAVASPDTAGFIDCGVDSIDGVARYWLAVELIEPSTTLVDHALEARLRRGERIALLLRVVKAVEAAHAKGVVHGDLKPSNIVVDASGSPKILDFGLARLVGSDSESTALCGTPAFLAPEQLAARTAATEASDVYSLGRIGEALLGPAEDADLESRALASVLDRAVAFDPRSRFPNAAALRRALEAALGRRGQWRLRWPGSVTMPFLALALLAVGLLAGRTRTPELRYPDPRSGDCVGMHLAAAGDLVVASRGWGRSAVFCWDGSGYRYDGALEPPAWLTPTEAAGPSAILVPSSGEPEIFLGCVTVSAAEKPCAGLVLRYRRGADGWRCVGTIAPSDPAERTYFGRALAVDGDTLVIGADGHSGQSSDVPWMLRLWNDEAPLVEQMRSDQRSPRAPFRGAAYVYRRQADGTWRETQRLVRPEVPQGFGFGYALSIEGDRLFVTNQYRAGVKGAEYGHLYVYRRPRGADPFALADVLSAPGPSQGSAYGCRVAARGPYVAVSSHAARSESDAYRGTTFVYLDPAASGGRGRLQAIPLGAQETDRASDNFGNSIAAGAGYVAIARPGADASAGRAGSVEIYGMSGQVFERRATLEAIGSAYGDALGGGYSNALVSTDHGVVAAAWHATRRGCPEAGAIYFWPSAEVGGPNRNR